MAHITEIKIDGLLGREDTIHHKLQRDVNIFFGENGSGKTTLLKVLDAAMLMDGRAMQKLPVQRAEITIYSIAEGREIRHLWERKNSKPSVKKPREYLDVLIDSVDQTRGLRLQGEINHWQLQPKLESEVGRWAHTFLPTTRLYLDEEIQATKALTESQFDAIFVENVNRSWLTYYSQVMTQVSAIQDEGLRNVVNYALAPKLKQTVGPTIDPSEAYDRVTNFLKRRVATGSILGSRKAFLQRFETEENLRRIVDTLNTLEGEIERAMIPTTRFINTLDKLFSNKKKVEIVGNELGIHLANGRPLSFGALSSGEKHLLRIFLAAMHAEENSLIIDEPELSMHIDWQRIFVESVNNINPTCQLILASHSPEIMANVADENIFRV